MLEEALPSIWTSMNSWFTPTVLFVLLNLMIGTIAVTSGIGTQKHHQQQEPKEGNQPKLARAPSVLERLKSINLYRYRSQELDPFPSTTTTTTTILNPPDLEILKKTDPIETLVLTQEEKAVPDENPDEFHDHHVSRSKSHTKPASGEMPVKLSKKMKKSASAKSAFGHFEEEQKTDIRPSTVKEGKTKSNDLQSFGDDEEVDAKADDFINKFKQQLKLQRLDSILRNRGMLKKGGN